MSYELHHAHAWDVNPAQARDIQQNLRAQVITQDRIGEVRHVAGVDVGFKENGRITRAAAVVLSFPQLELIEQRIAYRPTQFPYIPGYLSFREIPAVLDALQALSTWPDLILCDGQGLAHPRRFGVACHLGVLLDLPCIGVAKSRYIGTHDELARERGAWTALKDNDEVIGAVLRTRTGVNPVYVSVGHRLSLPTAIDYVMACTPRYRLPQTTRLADRLASDRQSGVSVDQ